MSKIIVILSLIAIANGNAIEAFAKNYIKIKENDNSWELSVKNVIKFEAEDVVRNNRTVARRYTFDVIPKGLSYQASLRKSGKNRWKVNGELTQESNTILSHKLMLRSENFKQWWRGLKSKSSLTIPKFLDVEAEIEVKTEDKWNVHKNTTF